MRFWKLLLIPLVSTINAQSKFDLKFENTDINQDYLKTEKSPYKIIVVNTVAELAALKNKDLIKAIRFELIYPKSDIKTSLKEILKFRNLEYLDTYGNVLIPVEINQLTKLKFLSFSVGSNAIPANIGKLKNIETLKLKSCGEVKKLPESLYELTSLKELSLESIEQNIISSKIGNLINLEKLSLFGTWIDLPDGILNLKKLKYLYCPKPQPLIFEIKTLETLSTYSRETSDLTGIKKLTNIKELYLSIREFNDELKELKTLKFLELTSCYKEDFPDLSELQNLEVLIIWSFEELKELPNFIYDLKNLKYLAVNTCKKLEHVSNRINEIKSLEYLELKYDDKLIEHPKYRKDLKVNIKKYGEI